MVDPVNRMDEGWKLYQKGNVTLQYQDDRYYAFEIPGQGKIKILNEEDDGFSALATRVKYDVVYDGEEWMCLCEDFQFRNPNSIGAFSCKHIFAAMFKLAEMRGVNQQTTLNMVRKEHGIDPISGRFSEDEDK